MAKVSGESFASSQGRISTREVSAFDFFLSRRFMDGRAPPILQRQEHALAMATAGSGKIRRRRGGGFERYWGILV